MSLERAPRSYRRLLLPGSLGLMTLLAYGCGYYVTGAEDPTVRISADPVSIEAGSSSTLTVAASNASQVTLAGSDGTTYKLQPGGGTQVVSPGKTVKYTVTASSSMTTQTATATATVTVSAVGVNAKPTVKISASPDTIKPGDTSILTVVAKNATKVAIAASSGARYTLSRAGGKETVDPKATTKYTVTASGPGGTATATATVTVAAIPKPHVTISAYPDTIKAGRTSILTVTAEHATRVIIAADSGARYPLTPTGGKQAVDPTQTTEYTVSATGPGGKVEASVTVVVTRNPRPSLQFSADPASIAAGKSSTLTAVAVHATSVIITGSDGSRYELKSDGGTQIATPAKTTTYTAVAIGPGGKVSETATVTVTPNPKPTVTIAANPAQISYGNSSTLTVTATNATAVSVTGSDGSSYTLASDGGSELVDPTKTTQYSATATGPGGEASASTTLTVEPPGSVASINHVIFMLQENHSFDDYFGMLNPYRVANGWNVGDDGVTYTVDGIDDKLGTISNQDDEGNTYSLFKFTSTCIDDDSSDWLASYGDVNRYDFLMTRPIKMDGFVHTAEGFAKSCSQPGSGCSGSYTDQTGERSMGYYDQGFLNYYYYMASQFAVSDRWFSPVASKSIPNRIATMTGGTTQGLVKDPGGDDHLPQLDIDNIFQELDAAGVSWKIYYTDTQGYCLNDDDCTGGSSLYPATTFSNLTYSYRYLHENKTGTCAPPTQPSSVVGDSGNSFCIDPEHIAPLSTFFDDLSDNTLPSFAFIEPGYGRNDEHPGSGQSILLGQAEVANVVNAFMASPEWSDSVFFFSYDEGGGPYDHVPPVPGHSNDNTDASLGSIPDISQIAVNPDGYNPCVPAGGTPTLHCDLSSTEPGANPGDAAAEEGFGAQLGFRLPNMIISPFTRRHYVSHTPMDHTAVIKFVESRFIGSSAHLTARDAAQPDLLEFFDFNSVPWATPPSPPAPVTEQTLGYNPCKPANFAP
jgi:phospholipase C